MTPSEIITKYLPANTQTVIHGRSICCEVSSEELAHVCVLLSGTHGLPLKTMFARDDRTADKSFKIFYVFGIPKENYFLVLTLCLVETVEFPSLAGVLYPVAPYERHIKEMFGLIPVGYPGTVQPVVLHDNPVADTFPLRKDFLFKKEGTVEQPAYPRYAFQEVLGEGVYEVPVGPVHAGIIEPGHFRFSMAGEIIMKLEPQLGWTHKGTEKLFETVSLETQVRLAEHISGDTSFTHSLAFCQAVEELGGVATPLRAQYLRVLFSELERLANHVNDVGYIMSDTGFNFGGAQCTRLRERIMMMNERLTGSRFLRNVNTIGGVTKNMSGEQVEMVVKELEVLEQEIAAILAIAEESGMLWNRMEGSGVLSLEVAKDHDAVGVAARASGMTVDARVDFPYAAYGFLTFPLASETSGDVAARFRVRTQEINASITVARQALAHLPKGEIATSVRHLTLPQNSFAIGIAECWRGDVVYALSTDHAGAISRVSVRDPSFINWNLIPHVAPGNVLLDFPLINKSFNLSYSGHDR